VGTVQRREIIATSAIFQIFGLPGGEVFQEGAVDEGEVICASKAQDEVALDQLPNHRLNTKVKMRGRRLDRSKTLTQMSLEFRTAKQSRGGTARTPNHMSGKLPKKGHFALATVTSEFSSNGLELVGSKPGADFTFVYNFPRIHEKDGAFLVKKGSLTGDIVVSVKDRDESKKKRIAGEDANGGGGFRECRNQ
jgi:hypothetical protein